MPSATALMSRGIHEMDLSHGIPGALGVVIDTGVGAGASYGLGQIYARYRDKTWGKHAPTITAIVGKLGAIALNVFGHGSAAHWSSGVLNSMGQAGVNAKFLELGIKGGMAAAKRHVVVLPPGVDPKTIPGVTDGDTLVGALPPAAANRALSFDQIEELASMH